MITTHLTSLFNKEDGQGLAEYALILAFIAVLVIGAVTLLGTNIGAIMNDVANAI
jgi:Flp pilus assembly pilin Flp